jgi:hypothetical protein
VLHPVGLSAFRKHMVRILDESPAILTLDFPSFPQSCQANDNGNTFKRTIIASFQIHSPSMIISCTF